MICRRCLRAAARSRPQFPIREANATSNPRFLSTTTHLAATTSAPSTAPTTAPRQGDPNSSHNPPAATSTSAAQPFSTPLTPSPAAAGVQPGKPATPPVTVLSSVPAGTPLKGLNFLKNGQDPVAMEDAEYPAWLWEILKTQEGKAETAKEGDLFSKSKKQRRLAAKRLRKEQMANPELLVPKVPIYEQSIDLPAGDGSVEGAVKAVAAREELRKAMRGKRRANIKETNFLKAMG